MPYIRGIRRVCVRSRNPDRVRQVWQTFARPGWKGNTWNEAFPATATVLLALGLPSIQATGDRSAAEAIERLRALLSDLLWAPNVESASPDRPLDQVVPPGRYTVYFFVQGLVRGHVVESNRLQVLVGADDITSVD